jgi:hypothetical protein
MTVSVSTCVERFITSALSTSDSGSPALSRGRSATCPLPDGLGVAACESAINRRGALTASFGGLLDDVGVRGPLKDSDVDLLLRYTASCS